VATEKEHGETFVLLSQIGSEELDAVGLLFEMYRGFARRTHTDCVLLSRTPRDERRPATAILSLSGPSAYAFWRNEQGLHRFSERERPGVRRSVLARVRVLRDPADGVLDAADVVVTTGRVLEDGRVWTRALHRPSLRVAEALSDLDEKSARQGVERLLSALIASEGSEPDDDRVVRVYYLDGEREVRDIASGVRTSQLDEVLSGDLFPFLLER